MHGTTIWIKRSASVLLFFPPAVVWQLQVWHTRVLYLTVPEPRTLLLLALLLSLLIARCDGLSALSAAALLLLLMLHLLARLCPRTVFYRGRVFCVGPVQGKRKHRCRELLKVMLRLQRWPCKAILEGNACYSSEWRTARQKWRSDQSSRSAVCFPLLWSNFHPHAPKPDLIITVNFSRPRTLEQVTQGIIVPSPQN